LGVSKQTLNGLVKDFKAKGILAELTQSKRNKHFIFERYIGIFMKD
jgi:hypothetical protein